MKALICLLSTALVACATVDAGAPFPATNTAYFTDGSFDTRYERKIIALEGQIIRIEKGPQAKPLFELSLPSPVSRSVWVGSLVVDSEGKLKQGHVVRVLGYLQQVPPDDTWTSAVTKDKYQVLGFCFLNVTSKQGVYLPAGIKQCEGWQAGRTPEELSK